MLSKKAGSRILSLYWIIIFVLISIGIVSGTVLFYSNSLDIREIESRMLSDKIVKCIAEDGSLKQGIAESLAEDASNIEEICGLVLSDSSYDENQYYIHLKIEGRNIQKEIEYEKDGSGRFFALCSSNTRDYPVCYKEKLFLLEDNEIIYVEIDAVVSKIKQNYH